MFKYVLKQLAGDSVVYGLMFALRQSIGIITFPIMSRIFVPADYGALDLIGVTTSIISSLVTLGISGAVFRYFYDYDRKGQITLVSTSCCYQFTITFIFVLILFLTAAKHISIWLLNSLDYVLAIRLALIAIPITVIDSFLIDIFRLLRKKWYYLIFSLIGSVLTVLLTILFVVKLRMGIAGALLSGLLINLLMGFIKIYFLRNLFKAVFDLEILKKLLKFGIPLVPAPLIRWVTTSSNRYVMQYYSSLNEIGLFSTASKISSLVSIFFAMIQYAWSPIAYSIYKEPESPRIFARILTVVTIASTFMAMASTIFAENIIIFLAPSTYFLAYQAVGPIAFGMVIYIIFYMVSIGILVGNQPKHYTLAYLIGAIVSIIFNFVFIPSYGMLGAAFALFLSYIASTIYVYFRAQPVYPIPYEISKLIRILLIGLGLSYISIVLSISILMKIGMLVIYPVILYISRVINKSDFISVIQGFQQIWQSNMIFIKKK